jgi:hypothetical protein
MTPRVPPVADSANEYRIEKVRHSVSLALAGGTTLVGDIFLQPTTRYRAGPQHPAELFNEPEPFIPLAGTGGSVLVAKEQIIRVEFEAPRADTPIEGGATASIDVTCTDGGVYGGTVRLDVRADRSRLLDFLNGVHELFLMLESPNGICLVNRRHIVYVRQRR